MPKLQMNKADIKDIINTTIELYKDVNHLQFNFDYTQLEDAFINGDKEQLIRVFNNLVNNAIQAIPDEKNGIINIELKKVSSNYLITIVDNGSGMSDEIKGKIFEPNFTTKSTGAGLGLAMVKQIIDSHKGKISFISTLGKGTSFFIEFPILENEATS